MSDPFPDSGARASRNRRPSATVAAQSAAVIEVQVVPLAASARRRSGMLRPSRRAADGRAPSFNPEAWCPDCQFYKLRRTPKKREPDDYRY